jgi:LPS-assembly lipoprotein
MSWRNGILRNALIALTISGAATLAGCSGLTPVYGERGIGAERIALNYAEPATRLDQIIYQDLALRLGKGGGASSPTVKISTSSSTRSLTKSDVERPAAQREAVVSANIELVDATGVVVFSAKRSAAALYTTDDQALASSEAEIEAKERAARALAETIRLTLLAALSQSAA